MHKSTGSFAPKTLKFKNEGVKQLPYSDQPTAQGTHCREMLFTPRCSLGVTEFLNYFGQPFYTTYGFGAMGRQSSPFFAFLLIFPIQMIMMMMMMKTPKKSLLFAANSYIAEC